MTAEAQPNIARDVGHGILNPHDYTGRVAARFPAGSARAADGVFQAGKETIGAGSSPGAVNGAEQAGSQEAGPGASPVGTELVELPSGDSNSTDGASGKREK